MPDITFVNPPRVGFHFGDNIEPLGILQLSAYLKQFNISISLIDADCLNLDAKQVCDKIINEKPSFVGITTAYTTEKFTLELAGLIKKSCPDIFVILGGVHATLCPERLLLASTDIDVIIRNEGELTLKELIDAGTGIKQKHLNIDGISYRNGEKIVHNKKRENILNLDDFPIPDRSILPADFYEKTRTAYVMTSRGCSFKCKFCASPILWGEYRLRSVEHIMMELNELKQLYKIEHMFFWDDILPIEKKRILDLCDAMLSEKLGITWGCYNRAELNDIEILRKMKSADCLKIKYGVESANPELSKMMWKQSVLKNIVTAVENTKKAGIFVHNSYQIGLPGETIDSVHSTFELAKELNPDYAYFFLFIPSIGTPMYKDAEPYIKEKDLSKYWLFNSILELPTISRDELLYELYSIWFDFYTWKGLDLGSRMSYPVKSNDIVSLIYEVQKQVYSPRDLTKF